MDEKDRLGDKLREKGKGDEDAYFAQRERERLARLKAATAVGAVGSGTCPRDGDRLATRTERDVSIDVCPSCGGVWLDKGELQTILKHEDEASVTRWLKAALGR